MSLFLPHFDGSRPVGFVQAYGARHRSRFRILAAALVVLAGISASPIARAQVGPEAGRPTPVDGMGTFQLPSKIVAPSEALPAIPTDTREELTRNGPLAQPPSQTAPTDQVPLSPAERNAVYTSDEVRTRIAEGLQQDTKSQSSTGSTASTVLSAAGTEDAFTVEPTVTIRDDTTGEGWTALTRDSNDDLYVAFEDDGISLSFGADDASRARGIRVYKSSDEGATWSPFLQLASSTTSLRHPDIAYANGFIFVVYERGTGEISIFRRPVQGALGTMQVNPPTPSISSGGKKAYNPRLVSDEKVVGSTGDANLYLAYLFWTRQGSSPTSPYNHQLFTTRSVDDGRSWTPQLEIASDENVRGSDEMRSIGFDVGGSAAATRLFLAYYVRTQGSGHASDDNKYAVRVRASTNLGSSFAAPVTLAEQDIIWFGDLDIAAIGAHVAVCYTGRVSSSLGVVQSYSTDSGASWDASVISTAAEWGSLGHDSQGNFYAAYLSDVGIVRVRTGVGSPLVGGAPLIANTGSTEGIGADWPLDIAGRRSGSGAVVAFTAGEGPSSHSLTYSSPASGVYGATLTPIESADITVTPVSLSVHRNAVATKQSIGPVALANAEYAPDRLVVQLEPAIALTVGKAGVASALNEIGSALSLTTAEPLFPNRPSGKTDDPLERFYLVSFASSVDLADAIRTFEADPRVAYAEPDFIWHTTTAPHPASAASSRGNLARSDVPRALNVPPPARTGPPRTVPVTRVGSPAERLVPDDMFFPNQWGLFNQGQAMPYDDPLPVGRASIDIDAVRAWSVETGDPGIIVAVLDDGIDASHSEFSGRIVPGHDFVNDDNDPMPSGDDAHGTAAAGIIAAAGNNSSGIAGVAWGVSLLPAKVLEGGRGRTSDIARAIVWAADQGASIISMSLGGTYYSILAEIAVAYAHSLDALVISAAGNSNADNTVEAHYPAGYPHSMSIGALSPCGTRKRSSHSDTEVGRAYSDPDGVTCDNEYWWGSNYGDLDVLAPGTRIYTTDVVGTAGYADGDYVATFNGTSAATPFVAGVAALVRSQNPSLTADEVRRIIQLTATDVGHVGWDKDNGHGIVNAFRALVLSTQSQTPGTLTVYNAGTRTLSVSSISTNASWLSPSLSSLWVAPGGFASIDLHVDWSDPSFSSASVLETILTLGSNDPDEPLVEVPVTAASDPASCTPAWEAMFSLTDPGGATQRVTIGQGFHATDGLDESCGEAVLSSGGASPDARFVLPSGQESYTDIRPSEVDTAVWRLDVTATQRPLTMTWRPNDLPDGVFTLRAASGTDPLQVDLRRLVSEGIRGGDVAMDTVIVNDAAVSELIIERSQAHCFKTGLASGWNLRSVPGNSASMAATDVFSDAVTEVRTYAGGDGDPGTYAVHSGSLEPGHAYWVKASTNDGFTVCIAKALPREVAVSPGWNLIGPFEQALSLAEISQSEADLLEGSFFAFDPSARRYFAVAGLSPSFGYWVKATAAGTLRFDASTSTSSLDASNSDQTELLHTDLLSAAAPEEPTPGNSKSSVRIADATQASSPVNPASVEFSLSFLPDRGAQATLHFGLDPCASDGLDPCVGEVSLPPSAPESMEARFVSGSPGPALLDGGSYRDFRIGGEGASQTEVHHVQIRWGPDDTRLEFRWYGWPSGVVVDVEDAVDPSRFSTSLSGSYSFSDRTYLTNRDVTSLKMTVTYTEVARNSLTSPVAEDDAAAMDEGFAVVIPVLENDSDPNGDPITVLSYTQPSAGTVRDSLLVGADSSTAALVYTPAVGFSGRDAFTYTITDGQGGAGTASVRVLVYETDDPPPLHPVPEASVALPGQPIAVSVIVGSAVNPVKDLFGVGFTLEYDPAVLALSAAVPGGAFFGPDLLYIDPVIDPVQGRVSMSVSLKSGATALEGSGAVARLGFQVSSDPKYEGTATVFNLADVMATDSRGAVIPLTPQRDALLIKGPVSVWPGLIDLNGTVSASDLFPVGGCFGLSGPTRTTAGDISWEPKQTEPWGFPVGDPTCTPNTTLDPANADANGDGLVDQTDLDAIRAHMGESISGAKTAYPADTLSRLTLDPAPAGTRYRLAVGVGTSDTPADEIFGVAARLRLPVGPLTVRKTEPGSLLAGHGVPTNDLLTIEDYDPETGIVETAATLLRGARSASGVGEGIIVELEVVETISEPIEVILESVQISSGVGGASADIAKGHAALTEAVDSDVDTAPELPERFELGANYPNPFNPSTTITYALPSAAPVRLVVFDALGREVAVLVDESIQQAGRHTTTFDAGGLPTGVYAYRLTVGSDVTAVRFMVLAK